MTLVTLVLGLMASSVTGVDFDYCKFTSKHTMCQYQGHGPNCNGTPLKRGVTEKEKEEILDIHNKWRSTIAQGKERRGSPGPQPGASDMKIMVWDEELARIAQRHADQCKFAHDCSTCRKTERFGVGQNLYIYKQTLKAPANDWTAAVTDWYDEVALFRNKDVQPFAFSTATGHYTQVVWSTTDKVGCGATSYRDGQWYATLYTCNYGPNGNFIRGAMYKQGPPCSQCGDGETCSNSYPGLCVSGSSANATRSSIIEPTKKTISKKIFKSKPKAPVRQPTTTTQRTTTTEATTTTSTTQAPVRVVTTPAPQKQTQKPNRLVPTTKPKRQRQTQKPRRIVPTSKPKTKIVSNNELEVNKPDTGVADGKLLFSCDFSSNEKSCNMKDRGKPWQVKRGGGNKYKQVELSYKDTAEFYFKKLIAPPASSLACLDFRFKKFSSDGSSNQLTVLAWPYRGKPGKVSISQESPDRDTWVRAQVTFKNVDRDFLLMFRARGPRARAASLTLAVDRVVVTAGRCQEQ